MRTQLHQPQRSPSRTHSRLCSTFGISPPLEESKGNTGFHSRANSSTTQRRFPHTASARPGLKRWRIGWQNLPVPVRPNRQSMPLPHSTFWGNTVETECARRFGTHRSPGERANRGWAWMLRRVGEESESVARFPGTSGSEIQRPKGSWYGPYSFQPLEG